MSGLPPQLPPNVLAIAQAVAAALAAAPSGAPQQVPPQASHLHSLPPQSNPPPAPAPAPAPAPVLHSNAYSYLANSSTLGGASSFTSTPVTSHPTAIQPYHSYHAHTGFPPPGNGSHHSTVPVSVGHPAPADPLNLNALPRGPTSTEAQRSVQNARIASMTRIREAQAPRPARRRRTEATVVPVLSSTPTVFLSTEPSAHPSATTATGSTMPLGALGATSLQDTIPDDSLNGSDWRLTLRCFPPLVSFLFIRPEKLSNPLSVSTEQNGQKMHEFLYFR
jgi:hypothetical protein